MFLSDEYKKSQAHTIQKNAIREKFLRVDPRARPALRKRIGANAAKAIETSPRQGVSEYRNVVLGER